MSNEIKENTFYIFTFGNTGVAKSTLMASLSIFIDNHDKVRLKKNIHTNIEGYSILINDWIEKLNKKEFPPITPTGIISQIDIGIKYINQDEIIPITLLEMSGEDLRKIDIRYNRTVKKIGFEECFQNFLIRSDIIFLVTSYDKAEGDDYLINQFFEIIDEYGAKAPIALIITKWDKATENEKVNDFILKKMKTTSKLLIDYTKGETKIFSFSVGEVNENATQSNNQTPIKYLDKNAPRPIAEWILNLIKKQ